jgi:hypothetical protein
MARGEKFTNKAGIVRSHLGRQGGRAGSTREIRWLLAQGRGTVKHGQGLRARREHTVHKLKREMGAAR